MVGFAYMFLAALSISSAAASIGTCYFPDGTPSPNDFVCNSTTADGFSSCCGKQNDGSQAYCMSNGLCLSDLFMSRGSCTDKNWKSKNCAQVCTTTSPGGGIGIRPCGYTGSWDCGNGSGCANSAVRIDTGTFLLTNAQLDAMNAQPIASKNVASSSAAPAPATASSSSAALALSSASSTSAASVASTPSGMVQASTVTAVGAGVGIPLGILAVSFLALWLFERKKSSRLQRQMAFEHQKFLARPDSAVLGSNYHSSMSAGTVNHTTSQHSLGMSQMHGRPQKGLPMQRMMSSSSNTHPAYRGVNGAQAYSDVAATLPLPLPPKAFQQRYAEAPGDDDLQAHKRKMSSAQELPADR